MESFEKRLQAQLNSESDKKPIRVTGESEHVRKVSVFFDGELDSKGETDIADHVRAAIAKLGYDNSQSWNVDVTHSHGGVTSIKPGQK